MPDSIQEVARLGTGDVVGELAPLLRRLRSATVQALEPTRVVEIPPDQFGAVVARQAALLRVIALALKARAALTASDVESVVLRLGLHLPPEVFASQPAAGTDHPDLSH